MKNKAIYKCFLLALISLSLGAFAMGQTSTAHQHSNASADTDSTDLASKIELLLDKVQNLEAQIQSMNTGNAMSDSKGMGGMGMKGKGKMGGMSSSNSDSSTSMSMGGMKGMGGKGGMSSMNSDSSSGMNMSGQKGMGGMGMMKGKGMGMMGSMKDMNGSPSASMQSALPGFPGASHLYHIGSTDFFLDHGEHIDLTVDQLSKLNQIKEQTNLNQASEERNIEEAEQELWELTAADSPDMRNIEKKIREIEKLKSDKRIGFIHAVGKASQVLTHDQHQALTGMGSSSSDSSHSSH